MPGSCCVRAVLAAIYRYTRKGDRPPISRTSAARPQKGDHHSSDCISDLQLFPCFFARAQKVRCNDEGSPLVKHNYSAGSLALRGVSPSIFLTAAPNPCDPAWWVRLSRPEGSFLPTLLPFPFSPSVFFLLRVTRICLPTNRQLFGNLCLPRPIPWRLESLALSVPKACPGSTPRLSLQAPSNRDTAVPRAAVPLRGRFFFFFFFFSSSFFLFPLPLPSSSSFFVLSSFFLLSSWSGGLMGAAGSILDGLIALRAQSRP